MGSAKTTTEQKTSIPGASAQEQQVRQLLMRLASSGAGQMGDLSALASGQLQLDPQMMALIDQINASSAEAARNEATRNYEAMAGGVAAQGLQRGIEGSSIDAVNQAVLGGQFQHTLDQSALQAQGQGAQMKYQGAFDTAGLKLNANQLLLNQILNSASPVAQLGLQERLAQQTTTQTTKQGTNWGQMAGQLGGMGLSMLFPPAGAAMAATRGAKAAQGVPSGGPGMFGGQQSVQPW